MNSLRIQILSDGRPGHFNLSEGITAALRRLGPTTVTRTDIRRGGWPGPVLAALTLPPLPASRMLQSVYGVDVSALPAADIVVSAGAETLAANVWLARARAIPNIFYGSLRWFRPTDFTVVLTSYARKATRPRHMLALKPSAYDPDAGPGGLRHHTAISPDHPPRRAGLLIGGDAGTFTYTDDDWHRLLTFLPAAYAAYGTRWHVSNSRRTPAAVGDQLTAMACDPTSGIERFVDVRATGASSLRDLFSVVDAVLCTDDSSSMVSEAIWARLPVLSVTPKTYHHPRDEQHYRSWLAANHWCRTVPIASLSPATCVTELGAIVPLHDNPLDALASKLSTALPQLSAHWQRRLAN